MGATVDDFMQRFSGSGTIDDQEARQYYDRFASTDERDRDFENQALYEGTTEYLGKLPDDQFEQAARTAYAQAPQVQRQGLLGSILSGLNRQGIDFGTLGRTLGLGAATPQQMDANSYAKLANYARRQHPEVLQNTIQQQPWFMKALGNPFIMGALAVVASRMIRNRR